VDRIDRKAGRVSGVTLDGKPFDVAYDRLLIASGASPMMPDIPGIDLPGVYAVKSLQDGRDIKTRLAERRVKKAVIIGMGYIALEMCETLRALDITVDMVKPRPVFLPWLEDSLADKVKEAVTANGVGVHAGHAIRRIERDNGVLNLIGDPVSFAADMVVVGTGVVPNSGIAADAGLKLGPQQSIAVDRSLRTSDENIYAAGDCADAYHVVSGQKTWIPLALRANRAGWAVADNVCGRPVTLDGVAGTAVFRVFDMQVATTGLNLDEAAAAGFEPVANAIQSVSRAHSYGSHEPIWVNMIGDKKTGRLLGTQMVGKEGVAHRINAPAVALHARMTVDEFSQTDLSYAPPFGPTWDPCLTAANQLLKKL
jgi:NADPH-dependent 2,4-dienoyl-CoA reductase/sulfur reductase-like enzyme